MKVTKLVIRTSDGMMNVIKARQDGGSDVREMLPLAEEWLQSRMAKQDALAPEWRALVYEHGQSRVFALIDGGCDDLELARDFLS